MKKIKKEYWFLILGFLCVDVFLILYYDNLKLDIMLSCAAIIVAIIAMGLSDKKVNYFKGKVEVWAILAGGRKDEIDSSYTLAYRIINDSKETVYNFVYRVKLPYNIINLIKGNSSFVKHYYGESVILVDKSFGFLGINNDDNFVPNEDIKLYLHKWKKGNIYFTVLGADLKPSTYKIDFQMVDDLINANTDKPNQAILISK